MALSLLIQIKGAQHLSPSSALCFEAARLRGAFPL